MTQRRTVTRWALSVLVAAPRLDRLKRPGAALAVTMLCLVSPAFGQTQDGSLVGTPRMSQEVPTDPSGAPQPRAFGVENVSILNIGPCSLQAVGAVIPTQFFNQDCRQVGSNDSSILTLGAYVHLPAGVLITEVTIHYNDGDPSGNPFFELRRVSSTGTPSVVFTGFAPDFSGGPTQITIPIDPPETVDNQTHNYVLLMVLRTTSQTFFRAAIKYRRQVSPAPAVASFQDVPPTHPFFRFVEALKASGITGGCQASPPLFCPDAPLTRGQMATFLSLALGLHFAP